MKTPKSSIKSINKSVKNMMGNSTVLYIVAGLALLNILGFLAKQNFQAVLFFLVVGLLTTYFSKNMIVVLLTSIVAANLFVMSNISFSVKEGMTNEDEDDEDTSRPHDNIEKEPKGISQQAHAKKAKASINKAKYNAKNDAKNGVKNSLNNDTTTEGLAMASGEEDDDHIDYSKTLEEAYGNLENILGKDGMKDISKTTQQLMEQQKMLMENMDKIAPIMKSAEGFIDKMVKGPLGSIFNGSNLIKKK
jgi:hypothetical protein